MTTPPTDAALTVLIPAEFPIETQTSVGDKRVLLRLRQIMADRGPWDYAEIGSYLGGSIAPFARDPAVRRILSIDDRGRVQPDQRGTSVDYTAVTHQTMLDNLARHGIPTGRVETFDGSVSEYPDLTPAFDLLFVDGEHTDWACFRDFIHGIKLLRPDCVVLFHDTGLIFRAIRIAAEALTAAGIRHDLFTIKGSNMSIILIGAMCDAGIRAQFTSEPDFDAYMQRAEHVLFKMNMRHRTRAPRMADQAAVAAPAALRLTRTARPAATTGCQSPSRTRPRSSGLTGGTGRC